MFINGLVRNVSNMFLEVHKQANNLSIDSETTKTLGNYKPHVL